MILIGHDYQGTDGSDSSLVLAIYELDGQRVAIPSDTPAPQIEAAVMAALTGLPNARAARLDYNRLVDNNQDLLVYGDYFLKAQRDLIALWKSTPNLFDTTTAVYAAVRQNKDSDPAHQAMYTRFLWYIQRTTALTLVSGDLPPTPTAAQAQIINAAAYQFISIGFNVELVLMRG
jgi:hypothetical protein